MPKTDLVVDLGGHAPVSHRITLFYSRFPMGRIVTELISHSETHVLFRALVYRSLAELEPSATGWAAERIGDGELNIVASVENTETAAVGRAIANLGLTTSASRPSGEELEKASRARLAARPRSTATGAIVVPGAAVVPDAAVSPSSVLTPDNASTPDNAATPDNAPTPSRALTPSNVVAPGAALPRNAAMAPRVAIAPSVSATIRAPRVPNETPAPVPAAPGPGMRVVREPAGQAPDVALQQLADRVNDVFTLIDEAERMGLSLRTTRPMRQALRERSVAPSTVEQTERLLRKWLAEHTQRLLQSAAAYP